MRSVRRIRIHSAAAVMAALLVATVVMVVPSDARAGVDLTPGLGIGIPNPLDVGIPGPAELVGKVFEFFFETFFGIEAQVTRRAVEWLLATPVYTDRGAYGELNVLRSYVTVAAWALFTLVFTVSGVRYYASGLTSGGRMRRSRRSRVVAWRRARWPSIRRSSGRCRSRRTT